MKRFFYCIYLLPQLLFLSLECMELPKKNINVTEKTISSLATLSLAAHSLFEGKKRLEAKVNTLLPHLENFKKAKQLHIRPEIPWNKVGNCLLIEGWTAEEIINTPLIENKTILDLIAENGFRAMMESIRKSYPSLSRDDRFFKPLEKIRKKAIKNGATRTAYFLNNFTEKSKSQKNNPKLT